MTGRKVDPLPMYGPRVLSPRVLVAVAVMVTIIFAPMLYWSFTSGGFEEVERLGSVKCLGCLGLDPVVPGFKEFWTVYPDGHEKEGQAVDHPELVTRALDAEGISLLVLFYWTQGCVPCAEQWEAMEDARLVTGQEDGGREGDRYEGYLLFSLDASIDTSRTIDLPDGEVRIVPNDLYWTYHLNGIPTYNGVPDTVFIFEKDGEYHWYMNYGPMAASSVDAMITNILYHEIAHAHEGSLMA